MGRISLRDSDLMVWLRLTELTMMHRACATDDDDAFEQTQKFEFDMASSGPPRDGL